MQNQSMMIPEAQEVKAENELLYEKTASYHRAAQKAKAEITEEERRHQELRDTFEFLKMRKVEYENARFEADQDIEDEREQAVELRKKIEKVVAEIDDRCSSSERGFADAVNVAVSKDFERVNALDSRMAICA